MNGLEKVAIPGVTPQPGVVESPSGARLRLGTYIEPMAPLRIPIQDVTFEVPKSPVCSKLA